MSMPSQGRAKRVAIILFRLTVIAVSLSFIVTFFAGKILKLQSISYQTVLWLSILLPLLITPIVSFGFARTRTALEQTRERLNRLSFNDDLTNLFNRRRFFELAHREILLASRYNFPITVLLLDIDHFKRINDAFGHVFGDHVLRNCAKLIKDMLRETDIIARFGGEEFIILMPHTELEQASLVAQRMCEAVSKTRLSAEEGRDDAVAVTISVGVAASNETPTLSDLITRAEAALFKAKYTGGNRIEQSLGEMKPIVN
jgi:diguanylate cyclase (GGDEF)-like protein